MRALPIIIIIIIIFMVALVIWMQIKDYYSQDDPMIKNLKFMAEKIVPEAVSKIRIYKGDKSYTINKRNVYLCLKDEKGEYYNEQILLYVLLHEISHSICKSIGHTEEFDKIFKDLLIKAEKMGYYDPKVEIPSDYCEY